MFDCSLQGSSSPPREARVVLDPTILSSVHSCIEPQRELGDVNCALFDSDNDDGDENPFDLRGDLLMQWKLFLSLLEMESADILDACNEETLAVLKAEYTEAGMYYGN